MRRLARSGRWRQQIAQAGLLTGIGLAFVGGVQAPRVVAAPNPCGLEGNCTFKKPLFAFVLDYSTSMNEPLANTTRWQAVVAAITEAVEADNGYLAENFMLGLIRFGHDPDPQLPGSKIADDTSGLVDGQRFDVPWYDPNDPNKAYVECSNDDAIVAALAAAGPPLAGKKTGIGSWTRGGLAFAGAAIAAAAADHPQDAGERPAVLLVITDGPWTDAKGVTPLAPAAENPAQAAGQLWTQQGVPTYVVALGDANGQKFADDLAIAGGTATALDVDGPQALVDALGLVIADVADDVIEPACAAGSPRVMVLLDASSSMLNFLGTEHAPPGVGGWDQVRDALAGANALFDVPVTAEQQIGDRAHLGLAVFGHDVPAEQKLLVQYGPCRRDNFAWALDPYSSCVAPGCVDPYAAPPIEWTFVDGSQVDPPGFDDPTISHMPACDKIAQNPDACVGSGTYTHLGLGLVQQNLAAYQAACGEPGHPYPCGDATRYLNILITDGKYNSTDAQVQAPLLAMHAAGVTTFVIGFGDAVNPPQLELMAGWGSGGNLDAFDADNQDQLEQALAAIVGTIAIDECCGFLDCVTFDPGSDSDPDPVPDDTTSSTTAGSTTGSTTGTGDATDSSTGDLSASTGVTTSSGTTATDPTAPGTTTAAATTSTGPGDPSTGSSSGPTPTTTTDPPTTGLPDGSSSADSSTTAGPGEAASDRGCACRAGHEHAPGSLGALLLALAAVRRRRR